MAVKQVLLCPVCGKSGPIDRFSMDIHGNADPARKQYTPKLALCHQGQRGRWIWTHHPVPLHALAALRQQLVEALEHIDGMISEAAQEDG